MLSLFWHFSVGSKTPYHHGTSVYLCTCVWEWWGAWLLSPQLDQHAGWGVRESGDWIQRLQAPALPLISPPHLTWPLCCGSAEAQLGHKDTHTHTHTALSASISWSYLSVLSLCLSVGVCPSLSVSDWLLFFFRLFLVVSVLKAVYKTWIHSTKRKKKKTLRHSFHEHKLQTVMESSLQWRCFPSRYYVA